MTSNNINSKVETAPGLLFVRESIRDWRHIGAVAPSSAALAAALTEPLCGRSKGARVLEVGAGTGVVTEAILDRVRPGSHVDVVEANPRFAPRLERIGAAARHADIVVHTGDIENIPLAGPYDLIVSGLPLTNFSVDSAKRIMDTLLAALDTTGQLTYFAYLGTGAARRIVGSRSEAQRHHSIEGLMRRYRSGCRADATTVWANIPPARAWTLSPPAVYTGSASSTLSFR